MELTELRTQMHTISRQENINEPAGNIMPCQQLITIESGKRGGKPCIRGMRITVYDILEYLAAGMSFQDILDDFPYLTKDDILACLSFAALRERSMLAVYSVAHSHAAASI